MPTWVGRGLIGSNKKRGAEEKANPLSAPLIG